MKVWNIRVNDYRGFDDYSFIQDHCPTNEQLDQVKKIYQNSGRYIKEDIDMIDVEIRNSFDNSKIPTWDQFIEYLKEDYKNKNIND